MIDVQRTWTTAQSLWGATWRGVRRHWRSLTLVDIAVKMLGVAVLTPSFGLVLRGMLALSPEGVLADQQIAGYLASPLGAALGIILAALGLAIGAFEAGIVLIYLTIGEREEAEGRNARENAVANLYAALRLTFSRRRALFATALRILVPLVAVFVPFAIVAALTAFWLLGSHDINWYLTTKPPEFFMAVAIGGLLLLGYCVAAAAMLARYFLAFPLVLVDGLSSRDAVRRSGAVVHGQRMGLALGVAGIWGAYLATSWLVSGFVGGVCWAWLHYVAQRPQLFLVVVQLCALIWIATQAMLHVAGNVLFVLFVYAAYRRFHPRGGFQQAELESIKSAAGKIKPSVVRWAWVGVIGAGVVGALVGWEAVDTVADVPDCEVLAHRAGAFHAPENTLAAVEMAIENRADAVEIDVQETADGRVVVIHDADLMKVAGVPLVVEEATLLELQQVDIGSHFDPRYSNQRVPELRDMLEACRDRIPLVIELKRYAHGEHLVQLVIDAVEQAEMSDQVRLMSLDRELVKELRELRPDWSVGQLTAVAVGDLTRDDVAFLGVHTALAGRELIRSAHQRNKEVYVWTVNDPVWVAVLASRDADGILTDDVSMARRALREMKNLSPAERLLIEIGIYLGKTITPGETAE
ncbi:hypothetical protein JCM19992_22670 [Thermostilla marina]